MTPDQIFQQCVNWTLKWEGGYVDDPDDAGKATNFGVTQTTYDYYCKNVAKCVQTPVKNITRTIAIDVYRAMFWMPSGAFHFNQALALAIFDTYVQFNPETEIDLVNYAFTPPRAYTHSDQLSSTGLTDVQQNIVALKIAQNRWNFRTAQVEKFPDQKKFLDGWHRRDKDLGQQVRLWSGLTHAQLALQSTQTATKYLIDFCANLG